MSASELVTNFPEAYIDDYIDLTNLSGALIGSVRIVPNGGNSAELQCVWLSQEAIEIGEAGSELAEISVDLLKGFDKLTATTDKLSPLGRALTDAGFQIAEINNSAHVVGYEKLARPNGGSKAIRIDLES
jgi:hypothetical protein